MAAAVAPTGMAQELYRFVLDRVPAQISREDEDKNKITLNSNFIGDITWQGFKYN